MREVAVLLDGVEKVKGFVSVVSKFDVKMDLVCARYMVDAKSILGIFSLELSEPIMLRVYGKGENVEGIMEAIRGYVAG